MIDLAGKTAVVTGAGTGIGAAAARSLAAAGARVVLISRTSERIEQVTLAIREAGGGAEFLVGDVRDASLLDGIEGRADQIDILVNNAAVFADYGPFEQVDSTQVEEVLDVDLRAVMGLTRQVLGGMKRAGWGRIIHIGSVAGRLGAAGQAAYGTAKAGLVGFTRSIAVETAPHGITSNLIEPGLVQTPRTSQKIDRATRDFLVAATPLGREGQPLEVAHAVLFLASPGAAAITGASLAVDGGLGLD